MILGMKREKTKRPIEKKTLKEIRFPQLPLVQTSLRVPMKKVKMNVPTMMGNQGTSYNGVRHAAALLQQGAIGKVKEVHVVTNRPIWS